MRSATTFPFCPSTPSLPRLGRAGLASRAHPCAPSVDREGAPDAVRGEAGRLGAVLLRTRVRDHAPLLGCGKALRGVAQAERGGAQAEGQPHDLDARGTALAADRDGPAKRAKFLSLVDHPRAPGLAGMRHDGRGAQRHVHACPTRRVLRDLRHPTGDVNAQAHGVAVARRAIAALEFRGELDRCAHTRSIGRHAVKGGALAAACSEDLVRVGRAPRQCPAAPWERWLGPAHQCVELSRGCRALGLAPLSPAARPYWGTLPLPVVPCTHTPSQRLPLLEQPLPRTISGSHFPMCATSNKSPSGLRPCSSPMAAHMILRIRWVCRLVV